MDSVENEKSSLLFLITSRLGLDLAVLDNRKLSQMVHSRMDFLKLERISAYTALLQGNEISTKHEWQRLANALTILETYFFRDKSQAALLRNWILPDLLRRYSAQKRLHIWSAACSTGEEPYTIAIILYELLPNIEEWDITIVGTDINSVAIENARSARYRDWSFRGEEEGFRLRYFDKSDNGWVLKNHIRSMVSFRVDNLLPDSSFDYLANDKTVNLIICRNVFIYFDFASIAGVLKRFSHTLSEGGYLMTGHGEIFDHPIENFQVKIFPESVIYQKITEQKDSIEPLHNPFVQSEDSFVKEKIVAMEEKLSVKITKPRAEQELYKKAQDLLGQKDYAAVEILANKLMVLNPRSYQGLYLMAQIYADRGHYPQAINYCKQAVTVEPAAIEPHYLQAFILEQSERPEEAIKEYQAVLSMAQDFIPALLELAAIYDSTNNKKEARNLRYKALTLLKDLPKNSLIKPYKGVQVQDVQRYLKLLLGGTERDGVSSILPVWERRRKHHAVPESIDRRAANRLKQDESITKPSDRENLSSIKDEGAVNNMIAGAQTAFSLGLYADVITQAEPVLKLSPEHYLALFLLAQSYANLGQTEKALDYCRQLRSLHPMQKAPYYLKAHILQEQGNIEAAIAELKRAIYLDAEFIAAYVQLALIYQQLEDKPKMRQMLLTAVEILSRLDDGMFMETFDELTVAELRQQILTMLDSYK